MGEGNPDLAEYHIYRERYWSITHKKRIPLHTKKTGFKLYSV